MLNLVINHKKCLTLNLNKEPNFVLTFFLKFTLCPNFIAKFVQKSDTFITQSGFQNQTSSFNSCIFFQSHNYSVTCYYVTNLTS